LPINVSLLPGESDVTTYDWFPIYGEHTIIASISQDVPEIAYDNNVAFKNISVANLTPPNILDVILPDQIIENETIPVTVFIQSPLNIENVVLASGNNSVPTECLSNTCSGDISFNQPGGQYLMVTAVDESGLSASEQVSVDVISNLPDLIIENIKVSDQLPADGDIVSFEVSIANTGMSYAENFNVVLDVDGVSVNSYSISQLSDKMTINMKWYASFGNHNIEIVADSENTVAELFDYNNSKEISIYVEDQEPPTIASVDITGPIYVGSQYDVSVTAYDNVGIDKVEVLIESSTNELTYIESEDLYKGTFIAGNQDEYLLTIKAVDVSGKQATYQTTIEVGGLDPDLGIVDLAISPYEFYEDKAEVFSFSVINGGASVADDAVVTLLVDGALKGLDEFNLNAGETRPIEFSWTPVYGNHNVEIKVECESDFNISNNLVSFDIFVADVTPPSSPMVTVDPASWTEIPEFEVTWTESVDVHGIEKYRYRLDYNSWQEVGLNTLTNISGISEGAHKVAVVAIDTNGNFSEPGIAELKCDNSIPSAPVIKEVDCGLPWTSHNSPRIKWNTPADSGSGVTNYMLYQNGTYSYPDADVNEHHPSLSSGIYTFKLKAKDALNHWSDWSNEVTVKIDNDAPVPPVITSTTHADSDIPVAQNKPKFELVGQDNHSGIAGYYYIFDQEPGTVPSEYDIWLSAGNEVNTELSIPAIADMTGVILPVYDGTWYLHAISRDKVGLVSPNTTHYKIQIETQNSIGRFDADGDRYSDVVVIKNGDGIYVQTVSGDLQPFNLFDDEFNISLEEDDQVDMARFAKGWPSALIIWDQSEGELKYYQSTGTTFARGKVLLNASDLPFDFDTADGDMILVGDLNGNDRDDLVFFDNETSLTYKSIVTDFHVFGVEEWKQASVNPLSGGQFHLADMNGDNKDDLIMTAQKSGSVSVSLSDQDTWQSLPGYSMDINKGDIIRFADITGDGKADGIWISAGTAPVEPFIMVRENISEGDALEFLPPVQKGIFEYDPVLHAGDQVYVLYSTEDELADIIVYKNGVGVFRSELTGDLFTSFTQLGSDWTLLPDILSNDVINTTQYKLKGAALSDSDADEIPDMIDNCPDEHNPDQLDEDNSGIGDVCEESAMCVPKCYAYGGQPGDFTNDNLTTVVDVQCTVLASLAQLQGDPYPSCLKYSPEITDLNCDGSINVNDVLMSIQLSLQCGAGSDCFLKPEIDTDGDGIHNNCDNCPGFASECY